MQERIDTLVLGIGNVLWADEGFGVRAVETLHRTYRFPEGIVLMDGGTQGLYLLPWVKAARQLLVLDAIDYGLPPGSVKMVRDAEIPAYLGIHKMSLHQSSFQEVLSLAHLGGHVPERALLIGVQPANLTDYGGSLSEEVRARLAEVVELAAAALAEWGVPGTVRTAPPAEPLNAPGLALDAYESARPSESAACRVGDPRFLGRRLEEDG